jgi:hypothetical protein
MMIPQDLINSVANQNAVFFCGAGISRGVEGERGFPGGRDLAREMAEKLLGRTVRDDESLAQIAQEVIWDDNERRSRLNEYLLQVFADPTIKPLRAHKALADLECNVITTNYDRLIERAFSDGGKRCGTIVREDDLTRMRDVNVVKIHGCVTHLDTIVITEEDYYRWLITDSEIKTLVRLWFLQRPIVFIGFSLSDPNLRQLYYDLRLRFGEALRVAYAVFNKKSDNYDMRFIERQKSKSLSRMQRRSWRISWSRWCSQELRRRDLLWLAPGYTAIGSMPTQNVPKQILRSASVNRGQESHIISLYSACPTTTNNWWRMG